MPQQLLKTLSEKGFNKVAKSNIYEQPGMLLNPKVSEQFFNLLNEILE